MYVEKQVLHRKLVLGKTGSELDAEAARNGEGEDYPLMTRQFGVGGSKYRSNFLG